jgi:RNA polymerase sigma-70 factor (ECF subfamily)
LLSEKEILESAIWTVRFQRGDSTAFEALVRNWEQRLFYYIRRLVPSEADAWELLQETWLRVYRSLGSLRDPRALPSFLYTTARNTTISRLRRRDVNTEPLATDVHYDESATDQTDAFDNAEFLQHALDQLPLAQREALTLYFLQDLSIDEIARLLEVPVGTVKSRLHYAKLAMRNVLGDEHG